MLTNYLELMVYGKSIKDTLQFAIMDDCINIIHQFARAIISAQSRGDEKCCWCPRVPHIITVSTSKVVKALANWF